MKRWRQHFEEITETGEENFEEASDDIMNKVTPITTEEIYAAIGKLKVRKAAGVDGVTPEMIRHLNDNGIEMFRNLLNEIIKVKVMPREWNTGVIMPLHKKEM